MKRTPLNRVSKNPAKVEKRKAYEKNKKEYLATHKECEVCGKGGRRDLHHKAGRAGSSPNEEGEMELNYTNKSTFMAVCRVCHDFIHKNPKLSREKGWLI